ncbi:ATP-binding protein [Streptomyces sp. NPDC048278]|uniref:ATP-binding protein n=1 Tax=unclassified Streptomyces TaxID=2593676 RepID=UPI0034211A7E
MAVQLNTRVRGASEYVFPMPPVAGAVPDVRRRAGAVLAAWKVSPDVIEDALLIVSELLTNAIVHALPPAVLRLSWTHDAGLGTLRIEVTDSGPARTAGQPPADIDPDEHGRGEEIVHALATRYGIHTRPGAITRWADLVAV